MGALLPDASFVVTLWRCAARSMQNKTGTKLP